MNDAYAYYKREDIKETRPPGRQLTKYSFYLGGEANSSARDPAVSFSLDGLADTVMATISQLARGQGLILSRGRTSTTVQSPTLRFTGSAAFVVDGAVSDEDDLLKLRDLLFDRYTVEMFKQL